MDAFRKSQHEYIQDRYKQIQEIVDNTLSYKSVKKVFLKLVCMGWSKGVRATFTHVAHPSLFVHFTHCFRYTKSDFYTTVTKKNIYNS